MSTALYSCEVHQGLVKCTRPPEMHPYESYDKQLFNQSGSDFGTRELNSKSKRDFQLFNNFSTDGQIFPGLQEHIIFTSTRCLQ